MMKRRWWAVKGRRKKDVGWPMWLLDDGSGFIETDARPTLLESEKHAKAFAGAYLAQMEGIDVETKVVEIEWRIM